MVGVPRHPSFRLLAAMNPATDAGKRDLPAPLRNRFTEVSAMLHAAGDVAMVDIEDDILLNSERRLIDAKSVLRDLTKVLYKVIA